MWFTNLFTKFFARKRLKTLIELQKDLSPLQPNRRACQAMLTQLRPDFFYHYNPRQGAQRVEFFYANIEEYTNKLKEINRQIRNEKAISPDWLAEIRHSVKTVDSFFVSADKHYLDPAKAVAEFKLYALELCHLMQESDTAAHGLHEHNLRMLTQLFVNLRVVTRRLVETSLTKV